MHIILTLDQKSNQFISQLSQVLINQTFETNDHKIGKFVSIGKTFKEKSFDIYVGVDIEGERTEKGKISKKLLFQSLKNNYIKYRLPKSILDDYFSLVYSIFTKKYKDLAYNQVDSRFNKWIQRHPNLF